MNEVETSRCIHISVFRALINYVKKYNGTNDFATTNLDRQAMSCCRLPVVLESNRHDSGFTSRLVQCGEQRECIPYASFFAMKRRFLLTILLSLSRETSSFCYRSHYGVDNANLSYRSRPFALPVLSRTATLVPPGRRESLLWHTKSHRFQLNGVDISKSDTALEPLVNDVPSNKKNDNVLDLWTRRLITNEDPLGVHKWASVVYSLASFVILATGGISLVQNAFQKHPELTTLPDSLAAWSMAFSVSNIIMCVASVRMSFIHRKGDLTARNAFLGTAVSSLFSGFFYLWLCPFAPAAYDVEIISQGCFGMLLLLNAYFIMDTMVKIPEVVEGRRDRKVETTPSDQDPALFARDALGYVLPIAWGLPVIGATAYQTSFAHDRLWFLEYCQNIEVSTGFPFLASISYLQVLASLAASYGALFVTLRDKKLISKQQEVAGITAFSVPAMLWTIWVTVIFYHNL